MTGMFFSGEKLLHNKRYVALCVIVIQKPLSLPATCSAASSELRRITFTKLAGRFDSNALQKRYELMVQQAVDVKEFRQHLDCPSYKPSSGTTNPE
jgi:hypothetical protein